VRWLLRKDLLILRRSRLLVALLVVYPVTIALLIGLALSRGPSRPRVAIVDETPPGETVQLGSQRVEVGRYARTVLSQVDAVPVATRAQAAEKVKNGEVLAAVVIPPNIAARLASNVSRAPLEVIYNGNALEQSLVRSTIDSAIAKADVAFSEQIQQAAARAIDGLLRGGEVAGLGASEALIGLRAIPPTLKRIIAREPPGRTRDELKRIEAVASFASANLDASKQVLATVGSPIEVNNTLLHGRRTPLNRFAVVVAVSVSLMFLGVLLAAGSVALEREEGVLGRLLRGLVSRSTLLAEKVLLAAGCALALALALLAGISVFVALDWGRAGLWLVALAAGALAFGAVGVAIGTLAREVRAASLLAVLASLPLAFLALVPSGSVSRGFHDAIDVVSFLFPYKAALQALDAAVNEASPALASSIVHLLVLAVAYAALARVALARAE
jgi:ABC-2 type transport system permease protein